MSGAGAGAREGAQIGGILLSLDPDSAEPPFRQLKAQIVTAIRSGRLTPGTRLPAIRTLATDVGVAAQTAAKVYRELEDAGLLEGRGRSGTFVLPPDETSAVLTSAATEFAQRAAASGFTVNEAIDAVRAAFRQVD